MLKFNIFKKKTEEHNLALSKLVWLRPIDVRSKLIEGVLKNTDSSLFDENYIADISEKSSKISSLFWRLTFLQFILTCSLLLNIYATSELSFFGLSITDIDSIKEFVFAVIIVLSVVTSAQNSRVIEIDAVIKKWLEIKCENETSRYFYAFQFADPKLQSMQRWIPNEVSQHHVIGTRLKQFLDGIFSLIAIAWSAMFLLIWIALPALILYDIWFSTNLARPLHWSAIAFFSMGLFISSYWGAIQWIKYPYTDYTKLDELRELERTDPARCKERLRELYEEACSDQT